MGLGRFSGWHFLGHLEGFTNFGYNMSKRSDGSCLLDKEGA